MKLTHNSHQSGFTLAEILTAMAIAVVIFAAILTASLAMQKTFNAVDNYFATHIQQIRIIDYLNRVTTSANQQTVTLTIPNYTIESNNASSSEASNPSLFGTMRNPTLSSTGLVNYGTTTTTVVYSINGTSILRTEDPKSDGHPVVTTIASSTDQLVPATTDTDLTNTEYTTMAVTFQPIFTSGNVAAERTGTTVFSLAYLRNKRRG